MTTKQVLKIVGYTLITLETSLIILSGFAVIALFPAGLFFLLPAGLAYLFLDLMIKDIKN